MNTYNVKYEVNSKDNCNYIVLADFHGQFNEEIAKSIRDNDAKYVIIAGDLVNGWQWENKTKLQEIKRFIDIIQENHKVIVSLGNHDLWKLSDEGFKNFKDLESSNVYPLFNERCTIDNNEFTSYVPSKEYYNYKKQDDFDTVYGLLDTYAGQFTSPNKEYINHLVSHNPYHFIHPEIQRAFAKDYDVIETGHFYDGWLPTKWLDKNYSIAKDKGMQEVTRNVFLGTDNNKLYVEPKRDLSRGLVYMYEDGYYVLLPDNSVYYYDKERNQYIESNSDMLAKRLHTEKVPALVITGAINTFMKLKMFYPYITKLELTKEDKYEASSRINTL